MFKKRINVHVAQAVYRDILEKQLRNPKQKFTENGIARELGVSPNTVSTAVRKLVDIGAAAIYGRYFEVMGVEKALLYWAATRRLQNDIAYATYTNKDTSYIERSMPGGTAYTAYTGYVNLFGNDAAAYGEVYVYATEAGLPAIKRRFEKALFSPASRYANLIVLKPDKILNGMIENNALEKATVPVTQLYVDLWNIKEWNAYEFIKKLKKRIDEMHAEKLLQLSRNGQKP